MKNEILRSIHIRKMIIILLCPALLFILGAGIAGADTPVSGQISTDTTWTLAGSPYIVTGDVSVYSTTSTPTLAIEPGVIVKFNQYRQLRIGYGSSGGKLIADGVTFTGTSPSKGWWYGIFFDQNSDGSVINNTRIEYGGYSSNTNIYLSSASINITSSIVANSSGYGVFTSGSSDAVNILNSTITNNQNNGIYIGGSYASLSIKENNFVSNTNYPLTLPAEYLDNTRGNTFISNTPDEIELRSGTITSGSTMRNQGIPYRAVGDIYVYNYSGTAPMLAIEPGVILKFNQYRQLRIGYGSYGGKLIADGVTFTGSSPSKGWWYGIFFDQNSDGSVINNSRIEYGGYSSNTNIYLSSASINITSSIVANSSGYGIYTAGSGDNVNIINNEISNNTNGGIYTGGSGNVTVRVNQISKNGYGAYLDGSSYSSLVVENNNFVDNSNYPFSISAAYINNVKDNTFTSNTPNEIQLLGGTIPSDSTMRNQGIPYRAVGDIYVYNSSGTAPTLIIESGVIVKFNQYRQLRIGYGSSGGKLIADGVTFTGTSPSKGWWYGIFFDQNSDGSVINNSRIEYGGYSSNTNIYISSASINITSSIIANSSGYGVFTSGSSDEVNILNSTITNNQNNGIYIGGSYASLSIEDNNFVSNTNYPLTLPAEYLDNTRGNTFISNTPDEIELRSGTITSGSTMRNQGVPYRVGDIYVYNSSGTAPTLIIESGVIVKFNQYRQLRIGYGSYSGKLIADGVTFTGTSPSKGWWYGIFFDQNSDGSVINNSRIEYGGYSSNTNVYLASASVSITNSIIASSSNYGIYSSGSGDNVIITNNVIKGSTSGIYISGSSSTLVRNNTIFNNTNGVYLWSASNVRVYHNSFLNNSVQAYDNAANTWDNGYPGGGNTWSDYSGVDLFSGQAQDIPGSDGIGDTPYNISGGSRKDNYPLMKPLIQYGEVDYELTDIAVDGTFSEGSSIRITATVTNRGSGNVSSGSTVGFYIDGTFLDMNTIPGLQSNESANTTKVWVIPAGFSGIHIARAVADFDDILIETNETNNEKAVEFTVNDAPDVAISSPASGSFWDRNVTIAWSIADTDNNIFDSTVFYRNDTAPFAVLAAVGSNTSHIWDTAGVPEGKYQIRVTASDGIDIGTATSGFIYIDHAPPTSLMLDVPGNNTIVSSEPVQFWFRVTDNVDPVLTCDLILDGAVNKSVNANNNQLTGVPVAGIGEGSHSWSVGCRDEMGRLIESETRFFGVDRGIPEVTLFSPPDNYSTDISTVNVSFTSFDSADAILFCEVRFNGAIRASMNASRYENINVTVAPLAAGNYNWNLQCKDDAQNIGTGGARNLNVTTDLAVENLAFDPQSPQEGTSTTIKAYVSNLGNVSAENVQVDISYNPLIGTRYVTLQPGETEEISLYLDLSGLASGDYNVTVTAILPVDTDQSNNQVTGTITVQHDLSPPYLSSITRSPFNITENTQNVTFSLQVFDSGTGVNDASVRLNYRDGDLNAGRSMTKSGNTYSTILTKADVDWDFHQGETFFFNVSAEDRNGNFNSTPTESELIDVINDVPVITIFAPNNASQWAGVNDIVFNVNNDGEGPVNSTIYFWQAAGWAPAYEENAAEYFKQGRWVKIADAGNASVFTWDTAGLNGYTRLNISATDRFFNVFVLSDIFVIDNTKPIIRIDNFLSGDLFVTKPEAEIFGEVNAVFGNISILEINDTRFVLALDPRGKRKGSFRFASNVDILENFSVKLNAADLGGNSVEKEATFIIDGTPPVIESINFENAFTNDMAVIKVNATDDIGIKQVQADLPSGSVVLSKADSIFTASFRAPSSEGVFQVNVTVTDMANNTAFAVTDLTIAEGPDLTVNPQDILFDPETTITGQAVNVTATIRNLGGKFANNVNITFKAGSVIIGRDKINITDAATSKILWETTGFAGNVTVSVIIENSTGVYESSYTNNSASRNIFIDGPDLTVTNIAFNPPAPVYEGQVVAITAAIENLRPIDANNVRISFYENAINLSGRIDFRDLNVPANGSVDVSVNWHTAGSSGLRTIIAEANTRNLPEEVDLSNNVLNSTYETRKYISEQAPDLLIFPQKPLPGIPGEKVRGMASNDFNRDNKTDFVAGTDRGKIILYRNSGVFYTNNNRSKSVNFTLLPIDDIGEAAWGMTSADLFGDGYPDIFVGTESGRIIFYNNSNGAFVNNITLLNAGEWAYGLAASDFNGDDRFDLVIGNKKGQVNIYFNNMTGNDLTNRSFVFNKTLTTRNLPFGMTTGDFDLDGHVDIMVGDRDGQIERIVYEIDRYNGFMFADVGAFAHGLTTADVDFSGKLDLFTTAFDGNVRLFYSREGGLVAEPLIIGNLLESYGLTSGDYDQDNDVDVIAGSDNGNVTMLMNSLRITKTSTPLPSPPRRGIEVLSHVQNPWNREMIDLNLTELWQDDVSFVKGGYRVCLDKACTIIYYGDIVFFETPRDNRTHRFAYFLNLSNKTILKQTWDMIKWPGGKVPAAGCGVPEGIPQDAFKCEIFDYSLTVPQERFFNITGVLEIFDYLDRLGFKEGFKYKYKFLPNSVTDVTAITSLNYTLFGSLNTPNTDFILSDDVSNMNNIIANIKNINPIKIKTDRDFTDNLIVVPDFTPISLVFSGYSYPPVPGNKAWAEVTIKNMNKIAINNVKVMFLVDGTPVLFGSKNYTTFNIGALGTAKVSTLVTLPTYTGGLVNITVVVNPLLDDIETNYSNNTISRSLSVVPPADLRNDRVYFSNGSVFKNVFVEGEPITAFTDISNIGTNDSYKEDVYFLGFGGEICEQSIPPSVVPLNKAVNCDPDSPDYNEGICSGNSVILQGTPWIRLGNIEPGENITTNKSLILGDFKLRSQGAYNFTTIVTNVGSQDENHANDANFAQLIVLPSQEDLRFEYGRCYPFSPFDKDLAELSNPGGNNITFYYSERNDGGYDVSNYDSIIYLDNNDSMLLTRIENESLVNHTSDAKTVTIDWSSIIPGDHIINFYLDYGKNNSESTARAVSGDGLIFISNKPGASGNDISVSIQDRGAFKADLVGQHSKGKASINVTSVAGFNIGDKIRFESEVHEITDINITTNTLAITPPLNNDLPGGTDVFLFEGRFRLTITRITEIVRQTAFDLQTWKETETIAYDQRSDHSDIRMIGDIVNVIQNGGYNSAGQFVPPSGLLHVESDGVNMSAQPAIETLKLVMPGSLTGERSDFNNQQSIIFRWKEINVYNIKFDPIFPAPRDIVTISAFIENLGDIRTGPFNVTLYVDGLPTETKTFDLLPFPLSGERISFHYTIPAANKLSYDVKIAADPENIITHEDETNNNVSTIIPVSGPFELNILAREHNINFLSSYENIGNNNFSPSTFGLENISMEYDAVPAFVDYDRDLDQDLMVGSLDGKILSLENTGTITEPVWRETNWSNIDWNTSEVPVVKIGGKFYAAVSLSAIDAGARSVPEFVDLDNDTLVDMVIGDTHGRVWSYKRVVTRRDINYPDIGIKKGTWVEYDFNLSKVDQILRAVPRFADLDGDGDYDLIAGNQFGKLAGYKNTGNSTNPNWTPEDFNLSDIEAGINAAPVIRDLDSDGDLDLVIGSETGISVLENTGSRENTVWQKLNFSLSLPGRTGYRPGLADLDNDGDIDLVFGSNNFTRLKLRKGYFEPVNVQIINYARNQIDIARIELSVLNSSNGNKITDLLQDGPFNLQIHDVEYILRGHRIDSQGVLEKEYDLNIPADLPDNTMLGVRASRQENANPAYFYELSRQLNGSRVPPVFIYRPELGGNTFDLFVEPGATYEYKGSYKVFFNGTMSRQYDCIQNWCPIYNLTSGEINTIVGSGEIRRLIHLLRTDFDIVKPEEPPILLQIGNRSELALRPGYIEDIEVSVKNNNRRPYTIDRIAIELFDPSRQTGNAADNAAGFDEAGIISLFTDTSGFTLPAQQTSQKKYKIFIPEGIPLGATLLVKGIEKYNLTDKEFDRSNIKELWPMAIGDRFSQDMSQTSIYDSTNITLFTDTVPWGKQGFDFGLGCGGKYNPPCGPEVSFLRKQVWIPNTLIKSEQRQYLTQACPDQPPSGITTWINGKLKSSLVTDCNTNTTIIYGWTPNFYDLFFGRNNELDLYSFGPSRQFDIMFYEMVGIDYVPNATIEPIPEAFNMSVTGIGNRGMLRRQYEEKVNITVRNNDDDPVTVDVVTLQLITQQNRKIHLLTDTKPRSVPPESEINLTYLVLIPSDAPLDSRLMVQAERVFEFPDKLWNRDHEISVPDLLAEETKDYHWGDTLPTDEVSKYRKHFFAPSNITRAELILGDRTFATDAYLNSEFQGSGYSGWSPLTLTSGLKQGEENLISVTGAIPDTESRVYSGRTRTDGRVIEPEEEVYFAVFGMREKQYIKGREPFFVLPGEKITARIRVENKYNKTLDYSMRVYVVDFNNKNEITVRTQTLKVLPFEIKKLEFDLTIPNTVSNETRLQLSSVWNELLSDKNWLRGSNFRDDVANNKFLDDSQWGVVEVGPGNERALYFRKHMWIDSTVQEVRITKSGIEKMWVNGVEVKGNVLRNEITKSVDNLITLKAKDYNIDADITLDHFVPVRSTDLEMADLNYSDMLILSQGDLSFENQSMYDCSNETLGECIYTVDKGEKVLLNFTLRNAGELFSRNFNLTVFAINVDTGEVTEFNRETITMHPFSADTWNVSWNTSKLTAGLNEFVVFADAEDEIIETSEFNNKAVRKIYVNAGPEIKYLDSEELQGYNENVNIRTEIIDEDRNLENITLLAAEPDNIIKTLNLSSSGNIFFTIFNNTKPGRYGLHLNAIDESGKTALEGRNFDIFDSLYLNVKTDKNVYFFTQKVRLTPAKLSNLTKLAANNKPVLLDAFDDVDRIKGGNRLTVETYAFDHDGDLLTLYVCKGNQASSSGCSGGSAKTYCQSTELLNPGCSFNTEKDDLLHGWFAFVVDKKGLVAGPIAGNYMADSTPPITRLHSLASDKNNLVDIQDDSKTIVTIQGETGMSCRYGKDPVNRFHKDRSFALLKNNCTVSGEYANCNLGNLNKDDPSRDRITNLTRAYVSCEDASGNDQPNWQNIDIEFEIDPGTSIYDDYQGDILVPGSSVNITGATSFCIDDNGSCTPGNVINNGSVRFDQPGVFHLRYLDAKTNIKDTVVFINSKPKVSEQTFRDRPGEHAYDVFVHVTDPDDQIIGCTLTAGASSLMMQSTDDLAVAILRGNPGETITTQISCTDGLENNSTSQLSHSFPNYAPMLRNIPDISLEQNENISIDMRFFGFDLENDALTYSVVSQSNTGAVSAGISSNDLTVDAKELGMSSICLKANDGLADSNVQCINIFVEDGSESKLKNNEFADTTVRLLMQIQYFDGNWQDEFSKEMKLRILSGSANQIDLSRIFEWNSSTSSHPTGLFRVLFRAVDENNNTLINRDEGEILDSYNFTLVFFNTLPNISGIPDQIIFENEPVPFISLLDYTMDDEQNIEDMEYAIANQTNPGLVNCSITNRYLVSCIPALNQTGTGEINVSVFDGFAYDFDTFIIKVIPYQEFVKAGNITYTFISDQFDVYGNPFSGFRHIVNDKTSPGRYNITVIVSDGLLNVSRNITVTIFLPGAPVLEPVGDKTIKENETLIIQLNATDPEGETLTFGTDAEAVLPSAFTFNENAGLFTWTLGFDDSGNYTVSFNVTDGNFSASETIKVTVLNTNRPPWLKLIPDIIANESDLVTIKTNATDPDNENNVTNDDNELTVFINDTRFIKNGNNFTWQTGFEDAGNFSVLITVGDGELTDSQIVNITILNVEPVQVPPKVINNSPVGSIVPIDAVITATFNKPMNHSSVEKALVISPQLAGTFSWAGNTITFIPESLGYNTTYNITITEVAEDSYGNHLQAAYSWEFTTADEVRINHPPVLTPIDDKTMDENTSLNVALSARDVDNAALIISASGLPSFGTFTDNGNGTGSILFAPGFLDEGTYSMIVTVSDGNLSDSDGFNLTVNNVNRPPVSHDKTVVTDENTSININLTAYDPDADELSFSIVTTPANGTLSGMPPDLTYTPDVNFYGKDSFTFKANDSMADSNLAIVSITVNRTTPSQDTTPPVIDSVTLSPTNITVCSIISIRVIASDNVGVANATANGIVLTYLNGFWQGSISAPVTLGRYMITIRAKDAANNEIEKQVSYEVIPPQAAEMPPPGSPPQGLTPQGGVSVAIIPKISYVTGGSCIDITIKVNSTENFDDIFYVYLNNSALSAISRANETWFNWISSVVSVPSRKEVTITMKVGIPYGSNGTKAFRIYSNSTKWRSTAYDTGGLKIT